MPKYRHSRISAPERHRTHGSTEENVSDGDIVSENAREARTPSRSENDHRPDPVDFEPFFNSLLGLIAVGHRFRLGSIERHQVLLAGFSLRPKRRLLLATKLLQRMSLFFQGDGMLG